MKTRHKKGCNSPINCHKHQMGLAIVEFTITLPFLLFLLFAAGEMGRLLYQYNTLTKATQDGARYLATHVGMANTTGELTAFIADAENLVRYGTTTVSTPLLPGPNTVAVVTQTSAAGANPIIVTATYTYDPMIFPANLTVPLWQNIQLAIPLTATVGMPAL